MVNNGEFRDYSPGTSRSINWVIILFSLAALLIVSTWLWITMDYARDISYDKAIEIDVDEEKLDTLDALWGIAPLAMLVSFGLYLWMTSMSSSGGGVVR